MKHKKHTGKEEQQVEEMNDKAAGETKGTEEASESIPECDGSTPEPENNGRQPGGELEQKVEELRKQSEENFNRYVRMQADFDNYKKRVAKERDDMYYLSLEAIMTQILPVIDNMERALASFKADQLDEKYTQGIEMVMKQLVDVLTKNGLKEIEAQDKDFDPNLHHAVMQVEGGDDDENKVKEVFQKGYILGNKVIRPTLVKVAVKQ
ncbi:MAG: nucleotide exchange factor GrpE [Caulobacteraceae bacterium]